ncbi:MAG: flippase-like domain-containing protein [Acidimicrobiales bacterium]|nr:flippase-like domain-containing protein [Acidimicrobiales bacterium]
MPEDRPLADPSASLGRVPKADAGHMPAGAGVMNTQVPRTPSVLRIIGRILVLGIAAVALYGLAPQLLDMWETVPRLLGLPFLWFAVMFVLMAGSYACVWWLTRIALPQVSWFVATTSQLVSNAVAKTVPGGGAMGAAAGFRMLSVSGINKGTAGAALTATAIISNGVLFMLPLVALLLSIVGAPVPNGLDRVAWGGAALFVLMLVVGFVLVRFDRPLQVLGRLVERASEPVLRRLHREGGPTAEGLVAQRNLMVEGLGARWRTALVAAIGNWLLDYFALVCALMAVGVRPRFSLVLLAYGAAAVLAMIPITPGGLGFVEAGLTAMLVLAGVPSDQALLATLAYRVVSYWLPLPAGLVAHFAFRHRYGSAAVPLTT